MEKRLIELHQQRGRLIERIAMQRSTLVRHMAPLRVACDTTDRALAVVRNTADFVQQHPLGVTAFAAGLFAMKPRWVWRWLRRGFFVWRSWRVVQGRLTRWRQ